MPTPKLDRHHHSRAVLIEMIVALERDGDCVAAASVVTALARVDLRCDVPGLAA